MRLALQAGVIILGALVLFGCARAKSMMGMGDPIAERQALMKEQGATVKSIQDKLKAGQSQAITPELEKLVKTSSRIPSLFPQGSLDPSRSRAKPEIWQKWSEFEGYAKTLNSKATQTAALARTGTAQATGAAVADLAKTTCGACHNSFRGPEIKK
jgi:cytochrome c556